MRCQQILSREIVFCKVNDTIQIVALKMRDANVGFLPVCDAEGVTVGVVTDRDLALRACAVGIDARRTPVTEVMTHQVLSCRIDDDLRHVEGLMANNRKSRILVQDTAGHPIGVISLADIARHDRIFASETMRRVMGREILIS
ncbi:MAG TPA: CBS domain-containing protein [Candidatus Polarisedimenticolia bacterium]|nr:CBS domain-containing protein [Candidatus Polarisedimenticolia bacterium]